MRGAPGNGRPYRSGYIRVDCGQYLPSVIEHINDWPNRHLDQLLPTEWKDALHELLLEKGREQVPAADL